jgi:hypothetical protein
MLKDERAGNARWARTPIGAVRCAFRWPRHAFMHHQLSRRRLRRRRRHHLRPPPPPEKKGPPAPPPENMLPNSIDCTTVAPTLTLAPLEGKDSGGGRPARWWGWLANGLGALATVEAAGPGRGGPWSELVEVVTAVGGARRRTRSP